MNVCTGMGRNRPRCSQLDIAADYGRGPRLRDGRVRQLPGLPQCDGGHAHENGARECETGQRSAWHSFPLSPHVQIRAGYRNRPAPSRRACKTNRYRGGLDSTNCPAWLYCRTDMSGLWSAALLSRARDVGGPNPSVPGSLDDMRRGSLTRDTVPVGRQPTRKPFTRWSNCRLGKGDRIQTSGRVCIIGMLT